MPNVCGWSGIITLKFRFRNVTTIYSYASYRELATLKRESPSVLLNSQVPLRSKTRRVLSVAPLYRSELNLTQYISY